MGGPKWSEAGNTVSATSFFGTINNHPLLVKVNNIEYMSISPTGIYKFNALSGTVDAIVFSKTTGELYRKDISGNANDVLTGNGSFANISTLTGWFTYSGITTTTNKVGIGVSSPLQALEVNGNAIFNGSVNATQFNVGDVTSQGKNLRIASDISLDAYDIATGMRNEIKVFSQHLYLNSQHGYNFNTIINGDNLGNVGIGNNSPTEKLDVLGNLKISGSFKLGDVITDYSPATSTSPAILRSGIATGTGGPRPLPPCVNPTIPLVNQINGMYHSWGYSAFGGTPNDMMMGFDGANGIIDVYGSSTLLGTPKLLLNYYCGKDVHICTGASGGNVVMANSGASSVVGIGTNCIPSGFKFAVNGKMICEGVRVNLTDGTGCWPDFVFKKDYRLRSLREVELFILTYNHLPDIPSENDVKEKGIDLEQNDKMFLQKIEEFTLYLIEQNKKIELLEKELEKLKSK